MIRTLLTTTAMVALLGTGAAYAQDTQTDTTQQTTTKQQTTQTAKPGTIFNRETKYQRQVNDKGYFQAGQGEILASTLIGKAVYSGPNEDADRIGDVNDVVLSPNGSAEAVIIGVGGFLGIGEKDVAVDFDRVSWVDRDGNRYIVVQSTKEDLEAAPKFDRSSTEPARVSSNDQNANGNASTNDNGTVANNNNTMTTTDNNNANATDPNAQAVANNNNNNTKTTTTTTTGGNKQAMAGPDRSNMKKVQMNEISADNLQGKRVYGANNEDIGEISDVLLTQDGKVDAFVVDVGGFLGMGEKSVAIATQNIDFMSDQNGDLVVFTPFTQDQLKNQPEYSEQAYQTDRNNTVLMAP